MNVTLVREFDASKLSVGDAVERNIGKMVRLMYDGKPLILQTPRLKVPFGIGNNEKFCEDGKDPKWSVQFALDESERTMAFRNVLDQITQYLLDLGLKNAEEWLNDDDPDEKSTKRAFRTIIKKFKPKKNDDKVFPDTVKVTIPWDHENDKPRGGFYPVELFGPDREPISHEQVTRGATAIALINFGDIMCSTGLGKYGVSPKLVQMQAFSEELLDDDIGEIVDSDDEDEPPVPGEPEVQLVEAVTETVVKEDPEDDSDLSDLE